MLMGDVGAKAVADDAAMAAVTTDENLILLSVAIAGVINIDK